MIRQSPILLFVPDNPAIGCPSRKHNDGCICAECCEERRKALASKGPYEVTFAGQKFDLYRIYSLYGVADGWRQHALKKIMCAGNRGVKTKEQDIREAIASLERGLEMMKEDQR